MQSLDLDVLERALEWARSGRRVWLLTVAQTFGASPRPPGSLAAIRDDGILVGSVSGGCIEDDLVARREEYRGRRPAFASYGVTAEEAQRFGLPCGGELEVIIEPEVAEPHLEELLEAISSGRIVARHVDLASGAWQIESSSPDDEVARSATRFTSIHGPRWRMLIIGASEIAHYLAEISATVDFQVHVCDPREEYRTAWRAKGARWIDGMPDDAVIAFRPDAHSVVLAVSHDPKLDDMALLEALKGEAFYVGAVGSSRTSAERRKRLAGFDLTPQQVARLRGPVGLAIGSRTPPEIAVAILADLIASRNHIVLEKTHQELRRKIS
ncbi:MAG: XdhC family protein [Burkholderiales bacterium]|nr:XdhC family protein [Burkholderiales bacterium]